MCIKPFLVQNIFETLLTWRYFIFASRDVVFWIVSASLHKQSPIYMVLKSKQWRRRPSSVKIIAELCNIQIIFPIIYNCNETIVISFSEDFSNLLWHDRITHLKFLEQFQNNKMPQNCYILLFVCITWLLKYFFQVILDWG